MNYLNPLISHSVKTLWSESGILAEADWQNMRDSYPGTRGKKKEEMLGTERLVH